MKRTIYVLIDNGHGIDTIGKRSPNGKIREYEYARRLAKQLYKELENLKDDAIEFVPILITPEANDISLTERVKRINNYCNKYGAGNCIMISIHLNAAANGIWTTATGWECYTTRKQNNSDKLATCLYDAAKYVLLDQSIRTDYIDGDPDKEADYYIIKGANCPAVLTENMFMDSKKDYYFLLTKHGFNDIVKLHVLGIHKFAYRK